MKRTIKNPMLRAASSLQYLTRAEMEKIHTNALRLLQEVGNDIQHKGARELLKENGCRVEGKRVYYPPALVEWAIKQAPSHIYIYDRDGDFAMDLGSRNSYYGTGSDTTSLYDIYKHEHRPFVYKDMLDAARLIDALPNLDFLMCCGLMYDFPVTSYEHQYEGMLRNSTKPQVVTAADRRCMESIRAMAAAVRGGDEELVQKPLFIMYNEPTSPLNHTKTAVEKLIYCAEHSIPTNYAPGMMGGATAPITIAGGILQCTAETLAGLVISQLTKPGAPFLFNGACANMDMKCMQPTYCSPETIVHTLALAQIGRELYNLPTWGFAGITASKMPDEQAVNESTTFTLMSSMSGLNLNHDVGFMNYGLSYSFDLLVMCDENIGQVRTMMGGVNMDEDHIAYDLIKEVGPKGHFLDQEHTVKYHDEEIWQPGITDRDDISTWEKKGKLSYFQRANAKAIDIIENYVPKQLTAEQDEAIKKIMEHVESYEKY